ncbi:MAG: prolyl oligopeptidase family serine peptidase [Burkholderiaceae bacterium]
MENRAHWRARFGALRPARLSPGRIWGLVCVVVLLAAGSMGAARASDEIVGFEALQVPDPGNPALEVGIWYPSAGEAQPTRLELFEQTVVAHGTLEGLGLPLVVISHGSGGSYTGHYDTALALARAGFVVVSVTHTGDNYRDHSREIMIWDRPRQISRVLDYMLNEWAQRDHLDPERIGMFGFSAGGFTTLAIIGGIPDFSQVTPHCREHPDEFTCVIVAKSGQGIAHLAPADLKMRDPRVKAAVIAAPALGFAFGVKGLKQVSVPIQLWRAGDDRVLPNPWYAEAVRSALPSPPDYHVIDGAGHYDFLAPCSAALAAANRDICTDPSGFDRGHFHDQFNDAVVRYFLKQLRPKESSS